MKNPIKTIAHKAVLTETKRKITQVEKEHGRESAIKTLEQLIGYEMTQTSLKHPDWEIEKLADYDKNTLEFFESYRIDKGKLIQWARLAKES